ncbi:MAG: amino acid adenylation domain-containing protein, partial [Pseudomonadales bacterium]|nr:amino acid adenylation domain-containing protein [Pseudomonadales bacterium]
MRNEKNVWHPLSAFQRSLWFEYLKHPESSGLLNVSLCVRIFDKLDVAHLRKALNVLLARHPILRVRLQEIDGTPSQCVDQNATVEVPVTDVQHLSGAQLEQRLYQDTVKPFDLTVAPLVRAGIYQCADQQCILLLVFDHLICDAWSFWRLVDELGRILEGESPALTAKTIDPVELSYFDYIQEQQEWLKSRAAERQFRYWRDALAGDISVLDLPTDWPRAQIRPVGSDDVSMVLSAKLTDGLRQLAKRHGVTLYVVLLAAYLILLHRLTGQDNVAVGSPMPARGNGRWSDVAGSFLNMVTLRAVFDPSLTVQGLIKKTKTVVFGALRNQDYPLGELIERLNPPRAYDRTPYFQNSFILHNARGANNVIPLIVGGVGGKDPETVRWGGVRTAYWRDPPEGDAGFDLALKVLECDQEVMSGLYYAPTLFERATVERWVGYWGRLLEAMAADENQMVDRIDMLGDAQRRLMIEEWNATKTAYAQDKCIHELFEAQVDRTPGAVALFSDELELSYGELNARANRLAHYLRKRGVRPDDRVAICVERSVAMVVALLAVLKAGGAYVPLDPSYPAERLGYMLADSAPVAVLSDARGERVLAGYGESIPVIDVGHEAAWAHEPEGNLPRAEMGLMPQHLAYVIYTSGSTGTPKGAMVAHRGLSNLVPAQNAAFGVTSQSRMLQFASFSFDACASEVFMTLCQGAALCIPPHGVLASEALAQSIARWHVTHAVLPPAVLGSLPESTRLDALHTLIVAGEASSAELLRRWASSKRRYVNAYGPTEATICASTYVYAYRGDERNNPPIGGPIANTQIYILDEYGAPVPTGVAGEIYIGG